MICPICAERTKVFGSANYHMSDENTFNIRVLFCESCNSFVKDISDNLLKEYFRNSPWTRDHFAQEILPGEEKYFDFLFGLVKYTDMPISTWLDFGCAYGRFIEYLNGRNVKAYGVEISDNIQKYAEENDLTIWKSLSNIPENVTFDVITCIDSFYYLSQPKEVMNEFRKKLNKGGLVIFRLSNRNIIVKFDKYVLRKKYTDALNDHTIGWSNKSLKYLVESSGFEVVKLSYSEWSKVRPLSSKLFYFCSYLLFIISFGKLNLLPGFTLIAKVK